MSDDAIKNLSKEVDKMYIESDTVGVAVVGKSERWLSVALLARRRRRQHVHHHQGMCSGYLYPIHRVPRSNDQRKFDEDNRAGDAGRVTFIEPPSRLDLT